VCAHCIRLLGVLLFDFHRMVKNCPAMLTHLPAVVVI
jgi:hypothetical protein